jgi:hypothetical protein
MRTLACCVLLVCVIARAALVAGDPPQELSKLSLEELMRVEVTLVTRRPEPVGTSAAAISADATRSGVRA